MGLFSMFQKKPQEVKDTLAALDVVLNEIAGKGVLVLPDSVKTSVIKTVTEGEEKTIASIKQDGLSPRTLALLLLSNVLGSHLASGQFHIYRGVLSMPGTEMLKAFRFIVEELVKTGYHTNEAVQEDMEWVQRQIQNAG